MQVLPVINCFDKNTFQERVVAGASLVGPEGWLHFDISDGEEVDTASVVDEEFLRLSHHSKREAHLMVKKESIIPWIKTCIFERVLVNWQHLSPDVVSVAKESGIDIGVVVGAKEKKIDIQDRIMWVEVLAVPPGPSGGVFQEESLRLISFLKEKYPNVTISIDGGVTPEVARDAKQAGADAVVSGSFIWNSSDHYAAFEALQLI